MTTPTEEKPVNEALIAAYLMTPAGKKQLKEAIQLAAAQAADTFPEGSKGVIIARALAGMTRSAPIERGAPPERPRRERLRSRRQAHAKRQVGAVTPAHASWLPS